MLFGVLGCVFLHGFQCLERANVPQVEAEMRWETGGILFREYCAGRENSLSSAPNSVSSAKRLGEFAVADQ